MKKMLSALALAAGLLLAAAPASAVIIVSFAPSSTHINVGDNVTIDMSISGLGAEILSAVDINFLFSSVAAANTVVSMSSAELQPVWAPRPDSVFDIRSAHTSEVGIQAYSLLDDATLAAGQAEQLPSRHVHAAMAPLTA